VGPRFVDHLWPTVQRSLDWVLGMRKPNGTPLWACTALDRAVGLRAAHRFVQHRPRAEVRRPVGGADQRAAARLVRGRPHAWPYIVATQPDAFEPKERWAMDWYYPVLTGCLTGEPAKARLADGWPVFAMEGKGIRCVSDEPWITASETAEASIAHAAIGDLSTATDLLQWTRSHRQDDGSYLTGIVYPSLVTLPARRDQRLHRRRGHPGRRRQASCCASTRPTSPSW
jgi:hypothetical protein